MPDYIDSGVPEEIAPMGQLPDLRVPGPLPHGHFEINGIRFPIPPQGIAIAEENRNFKFETLRTRESTKVRSGHSTNIVTVTALFTGNTTGTVELKNGIPAPSGPLSSINETLMPILYSLKKMPLCFVDNELLRTTLPVVIDDYVPDGNGNYVPVGEPIGMFTKMVAVSTTPGMPDTLTVEFQFMWFNHRPFSPRLRFRKEWSDSAKTGTVDFFRDEYGSNGDKKQSRNNRSQFISKYGHPSIVFNATAAHTSTDNIHEARPLLEWLWPYRYPSTNRAANLQDYNAEAGLDNREDPYSARSLSIMPPFQMRDFNQDITMAFTIAEEPTLIDTPEGRKSIAEIAQRAVNEAVGKESLNAPVDTNSVITLGHSGAPPSAASRHLGNPIAQSKMRITSLFHVERTRANGNNNPHAGVDIIADEGTDVLAAADGTIYHVQDYQTWLRQPKMNADGSDNGNHFSGAWIQIRHKDGTSSVYMHLIDVISKLDDKGKPRQVTKGQRIGAVGRSGIEQVHPHLHFEYWHGVARAKPTIPGTYGNEINPLIHFEPGSFEISQFASSRGPAVQASGDSPTDLESRYATILSPQAALRLKMSEARPDENYDIYTEEQLPQIGRDLADRLGGDTQRRVEIEALARAVEEGWVYVQHAITGRVAQIKTYTLSIDDRYTRAIPISISAVFGTNIVPMPLQGHRFPTIQYLGGQQTSATISFRAETEEGRGFVRNLQSLISGHEQSAIHFREFSSRRGIEIRNSLLNSMNIRNVIIDASSIDTVPGSPDGLNVSIRLVDNTVSAPQRAPSDPVEEMKYNQLGIKVLEIFLKRGVLGLQITEAMGEQQGYSRALALGGGAPGADLFAAPPPPQRYLEASSRQASSLPLADPAVKKIVESSKQITIPVGERDDEGIPTLLNEKIDSKDYFKSQGLPIIMDCTAPRGIFFLLFGNKEPGKLQTQGWINQDGYSSWAQNHANKTVHLMGAPHANGAPPADEDFAKLYSEFTSATASEYTNTAYPDLILPPNPITGLSIDTNPDFFLYNESDIRMCHSEVLKVVHGSLGYTESAKYQGLQDGLKTIDNSHEGILAVYGFKEGLIKPANQGKDGEYARDDGKGINKGVHKTSVPGATVDDPNRLGKRIQTKLPQKRSESPPIGTSGPGTINATEAVFIDTNQGLYLENDIAKRRANPKYAGKNEKGLKRQYDESAHRDIIAEGFFKGTASGEQLGNALRIRHSFEVGTYKEIFEKTVSSYTSDHYTIRRCFPTFKVYLVEEDGELDSTSESTTQNAIMKIASPKALDDFYGVNAIKEISIVDSKEMAASTAVIQLLDLDGVFYNRKYQAGPITGPFKDISGGPIDANGNPVHEDKLQDDNNPFFSTMIKEGMKIIIKMGFFSDPSELETVFVGQIVQFEGDHVLTIVCQSYGTELVAKKFGSDPSANADTYNAFTDDLIHDLLDREEVKHFGRWELKDINLLAPFFGETKLRPDGSVTKSWSWHPSVIDDNLYIPPFTDYSTTWARLWGDLEYVYWDTTIWDVMKEMELRHPGHIVAAVPYGTGLDARMTIFFGNPDMQYIAQPPTSRGEREAEAGSANFTSLLTQKKFFELGAIRRVQELETQGDLVKAKSLRTLLYLNGISSGAAIQNAPFTPQVRQELTQSGIEQIATVYADSGQDGLVRLEAELRTGSFAGNFPENSLVMAGPQALLSWDRLKGVSAREAAGGQVEQSDYDQAMNPLPQSRLKQFRNYELIDSMHDIIANNISIDHRDTFNSIELHYSDSGVNFATFNEDSPNTIVVNADDNIKEHHIRRNIEAWPNCTTTDLAKRYASQLLANSLMKTYKGTVTIMGRPNIRPYSVLWLYDSYSDMAGPIEVEEVVHTMSRDTGFITEIVPNLIVTVREEVKTLTVDAMGMFFTHNMKDFTNGALLGLGAFGGGLGLARLGTTGVGALGRGIQSGKTIVSAWDKGGKAARLLGKGQELGAKLAAKLATSSKTGTQVVETTEAAVAATPAFALGGLAIGELAVAGTLTAKGVGAANDVLDNSIASTGQFIGGIASGVGISALAEIFPIAVPVAGVIAGAVLYKFMKYNSTREPILITPLIKSGKPYITGIEGMESDGLLVCNPGDVSGAYSTMQKQWRYYVEGLEDAAKIVSVGWANFLER